VKFVVAKFTAEDLKPLGSLLLLFNGCGLLLELELANGLELAIGLLPSKLFYLANGRPD